MASRCPREFFFHAFLKKKKKESSFWIFLTSSSGKYKFYIKNATAGQKFFLLIFHFKESKAISFQILSTQMRNLITFL